MAYFIAGIFVGIILAFASQALAVLSSLKGASVESVVNSLTAEKGEVYIPRDDHTPEELVLEMKGK